MWRISSCCEVLPTKSHAEKDNPTSDEQMAANLEWQRQCQSVFEQQTASNRKVALKHVRNARLSRGSAYDHIRALDHAMNLAGIPLERFRADELQKTSRPLSASEERYAVTQPDEVVSSGLSPCRLAVKDNRTGDKRWELAATPIPRGLIVLTIDQGSKMYSAQWFMQHVLQLRLVVFPDPHHRTWNDALLGVGAAGLKYLLYEYMVVMNMPWGPWTSSEWFKGLGESWDTYLSSANWRDDLFQAVYKHIAADIGQDIWRPTAGAGRSHK